MPIDRQYLEATIQNVSQQEREGRELAERAAGARMLAEAMLAKLGAEEAAAVEPSPEGSESE